MHPAHIYTTHMHSIYVEYLYRCNVIIYENISYCAQLLKKLFIFDNNLDMLLSFVYNIHIQYIAELVDQCRETIFNVYFYVFRIPNVKPKCIIICALLLQLYKYFMFKKKTVYRRSCFSICT